VVVLVGDVQGAGGIDRNAGRAVEARCRARTVHAICDSGTSRQRRDDAVGGELAKGMVVVICDVDVAGAVDRHAGRAVEARGGGDAIAIAGAADVARDQLEADRGSSPIARTTTVVTSAAVGELGKRRKTTGDRPQGNEAQPQPRVSHLVHCHSPVRMRRTANAFL
jgi:hypothetical protein